MSYCVECGTKLAEDWKFCPGCGHKKIVLTDMSAQSRTDWEKVERRNPPAAADAGSSRGTEDSVPPPPIPAPPGAGYRPENVGDNRRTQRAAEKRQRKIEHGGKKRRKTTKLLLILLVIGVLVGAGVGVKEGLDHNAYRRSVETAELIDAIARNEAVMVSWQREIDVLLSRGEDVGEEISTVSEKHLKELQSARELLTSEGGLDIPSWHDDIRSARDAYMAHRDAWESHLRAVSRDSGELTNMDSINRIDRSFFQACRELADINYDTGRYPNRDSSSRNRIEDICRDTVPQVAI